ncbi:MAG: hypothetical protein Q7S01_06270 [bacterium]|nr:hypothetical protein [bacterium]
MIWLDCVTSRSNSAFDYDARKSSARGSTRTLDVEAQLAGRADECLDQKKCVSGWRDV